MADFEFKGFELKEVRILVTLIRDAIESDYAFYIGHQFDDDCGTLVSAKELKKLLKKFEVK